MIESIGSSESRMSPYELYIQYQQYQQHQQYLKNGNADRLNKLSEGPTGASNQAKAPVGKDLPGHPAQTHPSAFLKRINEEEETQFNTSAPKQDSVGGVIATGKTECQTCKNRKYQDQSDDPGVSFQAPAKINPKEAESVVRAHESEHVAREQSKASRQNRQVISQSVILHSAICPECGRVYISGGTTTTVTKAKDQGNKFQIGESDENNGLLLNQNI